MKGFSKIPRVVVLLCSSYTGCAPDHALVHDKPLAEIPPPLRLTALMTTLCKQQVLWWALKALTSRRLFEKLFLSPEGRAQLPTLYGQKGQQSPVERFVKEAIGCGLLKRHRSSTRVLTMPVFGVPKASSNHIRFILDCRKLNDICVPPLPLQLPKIPDLEKSIAHVVKRVGPDQVFGITVDLVGWFHQFPLCLGVSKLFSTHLKGFSSYHGLMRLAMGWKWSPWLAQETFSHLCDLGGVVSTPTFLRAIWLDNLLLVGELH